MPTYRVEAAKSGRAGCKGNPECKKNEVKIVKGELRFGTWVEIKDKGSWAWRHWGCVTPKILSNLKETCEMDMDLVDGYDEVEVEQQEKIKRALEQGHVDDDDWKGDPEFNRPGKTGFQPRGGKKAKDGDAEETTPKKSSAGKKRKAETEADEADDGSPPAKKTKGRSKKTDEAKAGDAAAPSGSKAKRSKTSNEVKPEPTDNDSEDDEEKDAEAPAAEPKAKRARASKKIKAEDSDAADEEAGTAGAKQPSGRAKGAKSNSKQSKAESKTAKTPATRKKAVKEQAVDDGEDNSELEDAEEETVPKGRGKVASRSKKAAKQSDAAAPQKRRKRTN